MSYSLLLLSPFLPSSHLHLSLSLRAATLLVPLLLCYRHPALATPPTLSRRGGVRSKFNFHRPTPLTYLPQTPFLFISFSTSPTKPPPHRSGDPQHPGKEATGCIPRDKLRGSIIHRNLQAPLFKRLPAPPVRRRYPARRDVNTKTGDFKWPA